MAKNSISLSAMEKLMKKAGADRVSEEAKDELRKTLEEKAEEITKAAIRFSRHAGRKTIKAEDIKLASE